MADIRRPCTEAVMVLLLVSGEQAGWGHGNGQPTAVRLVVTAQAATGSAAHFVATV